MSQPQKIRLFLEHETYGTVEISEPFKTDAFAYTVEQDKGRKGRDVTYGGEEVSLYFPDAYGIATSDPQTLPNGIVVNHLTMGLPYILAAWRETGFETVMTLIAKDYWDETISIGELDFSEASFKTDGLTYAECKVIQDSRRAEIKRQAETNIDLLSPLDVNGNAIQAIGTSGIFIKALPTDQRSTWTTPTGLGNNGSSTTRGDENSASTNRSGVNTAVQTGEYGIERSLGFISSRFALVSGTGGFFPNGGNSFTFVQAANELSNVEISITNILGESQLLINDSAGVTIDSAQSRTRLVVNVGVLTDYDNPRVKYELSNQTIDYTAPFDPLSQSEDLPTSASVTIPLVLRGEYIWIYFEPNTTAEMTGTASGFGDEAQATLLVIVDSMDVEITATSTAVSSVIQAVRYHDIYKQLLTSINGSTLISTQTDTGFLADLYAFNGYLLRGITDKPLNATWKDRAERLQAFNLDYQINSDNVYIGSEADYYPNNEIIVLTETPDNDFSYETNERATCNLMEMKLQGYLNTDSQDSEEAPTLSAVHTETQLKFPNTRVENILSIDVKDILDPITIEQARKLAITQKPLTTGKYDEKIMLIDTVSIPENTHYEFTAYLLQQVDEDGNLRLLNRGTSDDQDAFFDWTSLGFALGSVITITGGDNAGTYTTLSYDFSVVVLEPLVATPTYDGLGVITIDYPLDNVTLMNRTTEGFTTAVEGFSNQRFTPKRLAMLHGQTMANICRFRPNGEIRISKPPINADFTTQLYSESEPVIENEPIPVSELPSPLITANIIDTRAALTLAQAKAVTQAMETINDDGTIGGYITVQGEAGTTTRIYPQKCAWLMLGEYAELIGEEKHSLT
jgi:hypothetical protein